MDDIGTLEGKIGSITKLTSDLAPSEIARPTNKVFQKDPLASQEVDIVRSGRLIIIHLFYRAAGAFPTNSGKIRVKICNRGAPSIAREHLSRVKRHEPIGPTLRRPVAPPKIATLAAVPR